MSTTTLSSILYARRRMANQIELFGSLQKSDPKLTPEQKRRRDESEERRLFRQLCGKDPVTDQAA
ncbi:hypothetical protein [Chromobacterium subtsugae]|uniref:hypothetical protein n=1 Tax=Chromobacterium subtsugae TaxID=251747 RepID=UPI00064101BC|nr:hypothetical protein [Chromobacterium subtsugae]